jgi:hypothetical protein
MATGKLLGVDSPGEQSLLKNYFRLVKFTAEATGTVTEIKVYGTANGNVKIAAYADNSGEPGALIVANNTGQAVTANQWNTLTITQFSVVKDTLYWLAVNMDTDYAMTAASSGGVTRYKSATYSSFNFPDPAGSGFTSSTKNYDMAGWGVLVISPSGLSQPLAYGTPKLGLSIKPAGYQQAIAYGTPTVTVETAGIIIYPPGLQVVIAYGTPALCYPQTISPPGLSVPIAYGMPSIIVAGEGAIYVPGYQQVIAYGTPTIFKYVFHLILDGQYQTEIPETNRTFVIGRDVNGNPVWGEAHDSAESALVGERLDFQPDPAIPTQAQAADVAAAILSKMRLSKKRGVILIPYNCGQELWDVVQITDAGANQQAVKFRVVGIRFEYYPRQARYQHRLILGTP